VTRQKAGPWGFPTAVYPAGSSTDLRVDDTVDALLPDSDDPCLTAGTALAHSTRSSVLASDPEVPRFFGRFRITRILARGQWGDVYEAIDDRLARHVAIKVGRTADQSSFRREARLIAGVRHPGIVTWHEFGITDSGLCYLVCELMVGQSLDRLITRQRPPISETLEIIAQCADALDFAHQQGIIHRDVKPSNILLDARRRPRIADFGLALHETERNAWEKTLSGTPAYMAPEQIGQPNAMLDGRCDIWALGVILYELLTGRRPFHAASFPELFEQILHQEPKPLRLNDDAFEAGIDGLSDGVSNERRDLSRIVERCLEKQPVVRYATAGQLAEDLRLCHARYHGLSNGTRIANDSVGTNGLATKDTTSLWWNSVAAITLSVGLLISSVVWSLVSPGSEHLKRTQPDALETHAVPPLRQEKDPHSFNADPAGDPSHP